MWYYSINGGQEGPFDDARLDQLIAEKVVTPATFVWKEGMAEWTPLGQLRAAGSAAPAAESADAASCSVCGRRVGSDNLIELLGRRVCAECKPLTVQAMREGVASTLPGDVSAWRDGKKVVTRDSQTLPPRCCKCNQAVTDPPLKRNVYWHPWPYFLLIFVSLIIYVIVAIIVRKRATVHAYMCPDHLRKRRYFIIGSLISVVAGLVALMLGIGGNIGWPIGVGLFLMAGGIILGVAKGGVVSAVRIKDGQVWLRGAGPEFLAGLPPWIG